MKKFRTREDLLRELERRGRELGFAALARELGVSRQMVHAVLNGETMGKMIPQALGYEPVVMYTRQEGKN